MDNRAKAKPEPCRDRTHISATIWGRFQVTPLRQVLKSEGFCFQNNENVSLIDLGDSPVVIPSTEQTLGSWCQIFYLGWEFFKITKPYFFTLKKWKIEGPALSLSFIKNQNTLVKRKEELQIIPKQLRPFHLPGTLLYSEGEKGRITCAPPYPHKQAGAFSYAV